MPLPKKIIPILITIASTFSIFAYATTDVFVITKITNHIYIAHPGLVKRINSTSTIIVGEKYLTVIESQSDIYMAKMLIREIRQRISKLPIKYLIFSHFHSDHTLGAGAFLQENPSLIIIAHQKTAEHISLHASEEQKSWATLIKQKSIEAGQFAVSAETRERRNYYLRAANEFDAYYRDIQSSVIVIPNLTFNDSLNLFDKDLQVKLIFLGAAHTDGDIVVFIPQDKVLVTGDIVHDFEPLFWDADPDSWIRVLEKMKQIDFDYFVGGHGDTHKGKDIIYAWENYINELKSRTIAAMEDGLTLNEFQNKMTTESLTSLQNGYGDRIQNFRTSYMEYLTGPLLDAIKDEIAFIWKYYYRRGSVGRK